MPYLKSWEEFAKKAERLYISNPIKCRLVMKYRHNDGKLVVKITDNDTCLMYLAEYSQEVKKVEKLNSHLMKIMLTSELSDKN